MSATSLVELAQAYIERERPARRERAEERVRPVRQRLTVEGEFRLVHPGVVWEACQIWLDETHRFGQDVVEHVVTHPQARPLLERAEEVERFRRFIAEWIAREVEEYVLPNCEQFMRERGIQVEQEVRIVRHRAEMFAAHATKDLLLRIYRATRSARVATS